MTTIPERMPYTIDDILNCKDVDEGALNRDWINLNNFDALSNPRKFCGNRIIYKYQLKNLLNCRRGSKNYKTIHEWFEDPELRQKLWEQTVKRNRRDKCPFPSATDVYECHRINNGAIVPFKSSTAKYIYKRFGATNVLDPTAGWGGRMLGAMSLGISYTGYDTNINMKEAYEKMYEFSCSDKIMNWTDCLKGDFTEEPYDLVLTSPPYSNMEMYEHMDGWKSDHDFYTTFMMPLMDKLFKETNCPICINISPKMYHTLTSSVGPYNLRECDEQIDLRQQLGKQYKTKSQDYIYIWNPEH
jgi:hypothetical protein